MRTKNILMTLCLLLMSWTAVQADTCDTVRGTEPGVMSSFWCTQEWIDFFWDAYDFDKGDWDDGFGWEAACDLRRPLARTFQAIQLVNYASPATSAATSCGGPGITQSVRLTSWTAAVVMARLELTRGGAFSSTTIPGCTFPSSTMRTSSNALVPWSTKHATRIGAVITATTDLILAQQAVHPVTRSILTAAVDSGRRAGEVRTATKSSGYGGTPLKPIPSTATRR
jgi:hypothetical protein